MFRLFPKQADDLLDAASLPPTDGTEMNYRTRPLTADQELRITLLVLLVPLPVRLDILERGQILVVATLTNTGSSTFSGNYELRLAPESDTNVNDNNGGDFGLGASSFSVPVGESRVITINLTLSDTENKNALDMIKGGTFRVAIRVGVSSSGGTLTLDQGRIAVVGRPFAIVN